MRLPPMLASAETGALLGGLPLSAWFLLVLAASGGLVLHLVARLVRRKRRRESGD